MYSQYLNLRSCKSTKKCATRTACSDICIIISYITFAKLRIVLSSYLFSRSLSVPHFRIVSHSLFIYYLFVITYSQFIYHILCHSYFFRLPATNTHTCMALFFGEIPPFCNFWLHLFIIHSPFHTFIRILIFIQCKPKVHTRYVILSTINDPISL